MQLIRPTYFTIKFGNKTICEFRISCGCMYVSPGYFSIIKTESYCWRGVQLFKRKQSISKSIQNSTETGKCLSRRPRDNKTYDNMNVAIYTDFSLSCFFPRYFEISWKYNTKLRSLGKTYIIKHNYIDLWFWLVTRFINLWNIIMSWICWSQYLLCQ